jgi:hypothetical protein
VTASKGVLKLQYALDAIAPVFATDHVGPPEVSFPPIFFEALSIRIANEFALAIDIITTNAPWAALVRFAEQCAATFIGALATRPLRVVAPSPALATLLLATLVQPGLAAPVCRNGVALTGQAEHAQEQPNSQAARGPSREYAGNLINVIAFHSMRPWPAKHAFVAFEDPARVYQHQSAGGESLLASSSR